MTVRSQVWTALNVSALTDQLPGGLLAGGSLTGAVSARPFAVYRVQDTESVLRGDDGDHAEQTLVEVWVYDEPGSFARIEAIIETVKTLLLGASPLRCIWAGTSPELPDDEQKAITKNVSFQCGERS